ncbi:hypothetical protein [Lysobacter niastensis]|uniref:Lipoprotein n=1 Tax=Lysobacter niastensis TaxID=380629 RepID=A0ABS0B8T0_9GAMM|nr:hypothetical protein [Lysobacter niastensis]MBF6023429.1 hypothetical protein [Lysobacter niastensis]
MKRPNLLLPLLLVVSALAIAACGRTPSLQGKWAVDVEATIGKAKEAGIPDSESPQIREIYDGGQLEITGDTLIIRIAGFPEAIARNYKVVGEADNCYKLEINGAPGAHNYCIEGGNLIVQDPSAKLAIVYKGS